MREEPIFHDPYIEWAQHQSADRFDHDLGTSGLVLEWDWESWGVDLARAPADGPNWYGHQPLRERLAASYGVATEQVLLTPGCTGANALIMAAFVERGARVALESPVYSPPGNVARGLGARIVSLRRQESLGWRFDLDRLGQDLEGCALCFITNPHNPTGRLLEADEVARVAEAAARAGAILVVDEVYREFPAARRVPSAVQAGDHVLVTSSVTKAYGLGGLRVGWIAGAPSAVQRCIDANRAFLGRSSLPGEWLVDRLMANEVKWRELVESIDRRVKAGLECADAFVRSRPDLDWVRPDAGICGLVRLEAGADDRELVDRAREHGRVYLVPGAFFEAPGFVRLSFGAGADRVAAGLDRLGEVLDSGKG